MCAGTGLRRSGVCEGWFRLLSYGLLLLCLNDDELMMNVCSRILLRNSRYYFNGLQGKVYYVC